MAAARCLKAFFPVITVLVVAGSLAVFLLPDAAPWFVFDRERVLAGQAWRLVTGHAVHFSTSHALFNIFMFTVVGSWLERRNRPRYVWLIGLTTLAGSLYFMAFMPQMARYGGLSGLVSAAIVYLCLREMRQGGFGGMVWVGILLLFAAKVCYEITVGQGVFASPSAIPFEVVPAVHITGAIVAVCQFGVLEGRWRTQASPRCETALFGHRPVSL